MPSRDQPSLKIGEREETIDGRPVGRYSVDLHSGSIVFVLWGTHFEKFDSYAIDTTIVQNLEDEGVEKVYVFDQKTDDVFLYHLDDYRDADVNQWDGRLQFMPPVSDNRGHWEEAAEDVMA
jgi:hypothetical protein